MERILSYTVASWKECLVHYPWAEVYTLETWFDRY
jgi:hypothetical protein